VISAAGLVKSFGRVAALRGIDLDVRPGESLAVLGANGAGKTTLLRILATLDKPTAGRLEVAGLDALAKPAAVRARLGLVAHQTYLHAELTPAEDLRFYARLYGVPNTDARVAALLEMVGLALSAGARVAHLSRGQQQRLAIARALLHDPPVLLLDEPDTGLDSHGLAVLESLLRSERTVVFSSHNRAWATSFASRVVELANGRITDG